MPRRTGVHGALQSFARRFGVRTVLLPHAKIFNDVIPSRGHDMLCLTHPLQGGGVQDLDGAHMPMAVLDFEEAWQLDARPPRPLKVLGLVLNSVSMNSLPVVDMSTYLAGIKRLRAWCAAHDVVCRIRCRPNGSALSLMCAALGLDLAELVADQDGQITDFGDRCDLVLGYDVPTSGAYQLLRRGTPMVQALCRRLAPQEWRIVDPQTVPQLNLDDSLQRLDEFHADPLALWQFGRQQTARYLNASAQARPLRAWL